MCMLGFAPIKEMLDANMQASRITRLQRILEETKEAHGESEIRDKMQIVFITCGINELFQPQLSIGLKGVSKENIQKFSLRESNTGSFPWDLALTLRAVPDPEKASQDEAVERKFREAKIKYGPRRSC
ncbi:hypothetical protein L1987_28615 [Smallanthus sonchifolius]|uniref:Uncharacterized protein n=1 Tax=Smallanthus sonchifolius TaxID=185202 RepID=A0ACB9HXR3_9ASTR|nr:hypothetical protein L1987_28615 [Smallanthus sonchifolius]